MIDSKAIIREVLAVLGAEELREAKRLIGSRTLRAAVQLIISESEQRADLFIPHYWAVWYHDGRGPVQPKSARKLVFFANKNDDPRLQGGRYPVKESQARRLTRRQYQEGLRINQERAARGQRPFMYVVDSVGPARPRPFFDIQAQGAVRRADAVVPRAFDEMMRKAIFDDPATRPEHRVADVRLFRP